MHAPDAAIDRGSDSPGSDQPTETVRVELGARSYDIVIGDDVLDRAGDLIAAVAPRGRVRLIADSQVTALHGARLGLSLSAAGLDLGVPVNVDPGEGSKSWANLQRVVDQLIGQGLERSTPVIAFGGGVVGDLAGFAAAIALRGVPFIQVPTTLLAQVDSSVGGKTGINTDHGKNLAGAFHQPDLVIADTKVLDTLPPRELRAGYAEVVKYGLIDDPGFFAWLEANGAALLAGDAAARRHAIAASCRAKAAVVARDERESGDRALLNLGHTFGHALEAMAGYSGDLLHGEAVAIGMVLAFRLSVRLGLCPAEDLDRVVAHLSAVGLPTRPQATDASGMLLDVDAVMTMMARDKKVADGRLTFILARGIGKSFIARDIDPAEVRAMLAETLV